MFVKILDHVGIEKEDPVFIPRILLEKAIKENKPAVIESIRTEAEASYLKNSKQAIILAVVANIFVRFKRLKEQGGKNTNLTFFDFIKKEFKEYSNRDPNKQNLWKTIRIADYKIVNNYHKLNDFHRRIDEVLGENL